MDSFHLPVRFSIYKSLLIVYVSIKIHNILSSNYLDGIQRQFYSLLLPRRLRRNLTARVLFHLTFRRSKNLLFCCWSLLRAWRPIDVLQRCFIRPTRSRAEVSSDSLFGGSKSKHERTHRTGDASYWRRGSSKNCSLLISTVLKLVDWDGISDNVNSKWFIGNCHPRFYYSRSGWDV